MDMDVAEVRFPSENLKNFRGFLKPDDPNLSAPHLTGPIDDHEDVAMPLSDLSRRRALC